jgi:hypothetical protein
MCEAMCTECVDAVRFVSFSPGFSWSLYYLDFSIVADAIYRIFIFTLAALTAVSTPCLHASTPPQMAMCLDLALQAFDSVKGISLSLDYLGEILQEKIAHTTEKQT